MTDSRKVLGGNKLETDQQGRNIMSMQERGSMEKGQTAQCLIGLQVSFEPQWEALQDFRKRNNIN